jgi:hypothetical protein
MFRPNKKAFHSHELDFYFTGLDAVPYVHDFPCETLKQGCSTNKCVGLI